MMKCRSNLKVLGSSSKGNCYLLSTSKEVLIIECGIKYKDILKGLDYDLSNVVGCLVTHEHKDHCKSIKELIENGIDVYLSKGTYDNFCKSYNKDYLHRLKIVKSEKLKVIGGFKIYPFKTHHDAAEPLGFLIYHKEIGNLLFLTDTSYCDYNFRNLNHILVECNYSKDFMDPEVLTLRNRIVNNHFELNNVITFLQSNNLDYIKNIMLIHLSNSNSEGSFFKEEVEKNIGLPIQIANEGIEIDINI